MLERISKYILIFLSFVLLISFLIRKVTDFDIWWHLKTGEYIIKNHTIPHSDIFSYTASKKEWIDSQWLFQVIAYKVYEFTGINGLIFMQAFIISITLLFLFKIFYQPKNYLVAVFIFLLTVLTVNERFLIRPEMFSFLFIALFFFILDLYKQGHSENTIFLLPFIQLLWVNIHSLFFVGNVILFIYIIAAIIDKKIVSQFRTDAVLLSNRQIIKLAIVGVLVILVGFLNPYTIRGFLFPLFLFKEISTTTIYKEIITEFQPPFSGHYENSIILFYKIFIVCSFLSIVLNIKKIDTAQILLYVSFLVLSVLARRNIALFALISAPITINNLNNLSSFFLRKTKIRIIVSLLLCILILKIIMSVVSNRYYISEGNLTQTGLGVSEYSYPEKALEFVKNIGYNGNIFNDSKSGGYFIWKCYPAIKVFIDGRLEVYGEEFFVFREQILEKSKPWKELETRYNIDCIIICHYSREAKCLLFDLYRNKDWDIVFLDENASVFLKKIPKNKAVIDKYHIDLQKYIVKGYEDSIYGCFSLAGFYLKIGLYKKAEQEYKRLVIKYPEYSMIYFNLGLAYKRTGKNELANENFQKTLEFNPWWNKANQHIYYTSAYYIANFYYNSKQTDLAMKYYVKAINLGSTYPENYYNLAKIYFHKGAPKQAVKVYRRLLKKKPNDSTAYLNLGIAYFKLHNHKKAKKQFEKVLEIEPDNKKALEYLSELDVY
ncbi:MAG: tetratricopeptide repeat protein [Elusimicrobiota bacterium]